jgi:2-polyprenyl-3-methyl-5-hydroxy-6-metoxy-1,4-benzoquinol methylase
MLKKAGEYYSVQREEMLQFIPGPAQKILDVGCGIGAFAAQLASKDREIWGVEIDPESASEASKHLFRVLNGKIETEIANLPDNYFDAIVFNDVLEHLYDPWDVIEKIKHKLTKGGNLICSIPNVRYIRNLGHLLFDRDWHYSDSGILDSTHVRFFTKKSMYRLMKDSGYTILKIKGINKTRSERLHIYSFILNLFTLFSDRDILYLQYAIVATKGSSDN